MDGDLLLSSLPISKTGKSVIEVIEETVRISGDVLLSRFSQEKKIKSKGPKDIVTDVDVAVEKLIFEQLTSHFPGMGMIGEESFKGDMPGGFVWVVDPIDGTRNFAAGIPIFSIVLALSYDGEVVAGANFDPKKNELFIAEKGKGAFLNGKQINISDKTELEKSIIGMDLSYGDDGGRFGFEVIQKLWPDIQTVRIIGSSALGISYVAAGRTDLYFNYNLKPWDIAAGILLVEEAGGVATDRKGRKASLFSEGIIVSNQKLHNSFLNITDKMNWRN